ncbi:Vinorine synthase [Morus notabilis]|uniref:Vinorine synthase n=1 Tax=Morus notabilis TaxID=981085 RepID=W9RSY9_9ROSA|nr:Vinorine synthase [Morus notabilis]
MGSGAKARDEEQEGMSAHSPCKAPPSSASSLPRNSLRLNWSLDCYKLLKSIFPTTISSTAYFEARVLYTELSSVLENPIPCELNKLLPFELDEIAEFPLGVQLNVFECGGIAIGLCFFPRLEDALSCLVFVRSWMAIARRGNDVVMQPEFISGDLFPTRNMRGYDPSFSIKKNMC